MVIWKWCVPNAIPKIKKKIDIFLDILKFFFNFEILSYSETLKFANKKWVS